MPIELHVEPRKVYNWKDFRRQKPPYSIALDGFVDKPSRWDLRGPYANFDHHSESNIFSTRSTCEQVHMRISRGLFNLFRKNGEPHAHVFVNHADGDSSLSWWQLKNHELVTGPDKVKIGKLVYYEDMLDCTSGTYPFEDESMTRKIAWIIEPYNNARVKGELDNMGEIEMVDLIDCIEKRIDDYVSGKSGEVSLEGHYEIIGGGPCWVMTRETGPASRMAMYNDGIKAYVTLVTESEDGSFVYALGKNEFERNFNPRKIYKKLS